ncbi:MAG: PD-(D/E)XK nuclease family protein, partial [Candidatus Methanomethylicaceae archaeon]
ARLREDMVAGFKRHDEEIARLREDMVAGFKRHDEEIARLREDMVAGFKRHDEEIARLREDMNKGFVLVERHISALGARWGMIAEDAFREGLKGLLEKEMNLKVERWFRKDEEGRVFGYPSTIEVDAAVHDGRVVLVEVKSHVGASDVSLFKRKVDFYEKETGKKVARKLMVTPYADEKALEAARSLGIEIYTKV